MLKIKINTKFNSSYIKLTLSYVVIVMMISAIFSIVVYQISSGELDRGLGRQSRVLRDIPNDQFMVPQMLDFEQLRQAQIDESNHRIIINLIYFNLLILVVSSASSYFLARLTLRPIEEAMEAQNRFTADASHELRTPLTAMKSEIEVNMRDNKITAEEAKKILASNLEEIEKLETLSKSLLKLARHQENSDSIFNNISLSEVIVESYEKVGSLSEKKSIEINCDPELDSEISYFKVRGDKQSLVELFVILLDNAIKYSPAKSTIKISIIKTDGHVLIKIIDQGIGIKACDLPHIFDRFYRADHSRNKEKVSGYGLGLSIAKNIVELHNGTIYANSKPGNGSEFIVKFRIARA